MTPRFSTINRDSEHTVNLLLNGSALRIQVRQSQYILSSQPSPYYHRHWGHREHDLFIHCSEAEIKLRFVRMPSPPMKPMDHPH